MDNFTFFNFCFFYYGFIYFILQDLRFNPLNFTNGTTRTFVRGGQYMVGGGGKGGFPPFSKIFQKQKCFYKGFKSKKRKFLVVACRFGCVQFKSIFCSCVFTKFILPTAVKWIIWVNSLNMCANGKRVFFKYLV